jgi:hypothetical protein
LSKPVLPLFYFIQCLIELAYLSLEHFTPSLPLLDVGSNDHKEDNEENDIFKKNRIGRDEFTPDNIDDDLEYGQAAKAIDQHQHISFLFPFFLNDLRGRPFFYLPYRCVSCQYVIKDRISDIPDALNIPGFLFPLPAEIK